MASLQSLIERFDAMSRGSFLDGVKHEIAQSGLELTARCFRTQTDPYGVRWPGLKKPRPGGPVEDKTGAMKGSALAAPSGEGIRFSLPTSYSGFQHWGTKKNPQRRLLPVAWLGLPRSWSEMIQRAYDRALRKAAA